MPTPTNTPFVSPQAAPVPPVAPNPSRATIALVKVYEVTCIEVDSMERAVSVQEPEGVHVCVRRVHWAKFELDLRPLTHPAVMVKVESLELLPFEPRKTYALTFQPV